MAVGRTTFSGDPTLVIGPGVFVFENFEGFFQKASVTAELPDGSEETTDFDGFGKGDLVPGSQLGSNVQVVPPVPF